VETVARFARNLAGRDFVVGDVHGCFDELEAALARLRFDGARDRAFAVGDLVDRGSRSEAALEWMQRPWFHSCRGNHEDMRLMPIEPAELAAFLLFNGGEWWFGLDAAAKLLFTRAMAALPIALEVETSAGHVGIVHADVPEQLSWPQFVQALEAGDPRVQEEAVWGRRRAEGWVSTPVEGIGCVVCGHTMMPDCRIHVVGNVWLIDTGAFLGPPAGHLTVLPLTELFRDSASSTPAAVRS
jgi:serine/threonine protein phosphatase 1